jgi:hypothetical protein
MVTVRPRAMWFEVTSKWKKLCGISGASHRIEMSQSQL